MTPNSTITYTASMLATASDQRNVVVRVNSGRGTEDESGPADIVDHRRLVRRVDLVAQAAHVHVHEIGLRNELVLPHFLEEHGARQHLILAAHHVFEQPELARKQLDLAIAALDRALDEIELERADLQLGRARIGR